MDRPQPSWAGARGTGAVRAGVQVAAAGSGAVVLFLVLVVTGLQGLRETEAAHAALATIDVAQGRFQDADMAHDAILADSLVTLDALEHPDDPFTGHGAHTVRDDVREFRADLDLVDAAALPPDLAAQVRQVRPQQDRYARDALRLTELVEAAAEGGADPAEVARARSAMARLDAQHARLVADQEVVTAAMSAELEARRAAAAADERSVRMRLGTASGIALLGLLGLLLLVERLGSRLLGALARERGVAEALQLSLLPERLPDLPAVGLAARYRAGSVGTQVGGDWYDVLTLPGGRLGLVIGDVTGHDLRAAAAMGQLRNALRAYAAEGAEPELVLARLNRLCVSQGLGDVATVLYAVLDPGAGQVCLASAGHYPPLLVAAGSASFLEGPAGPPVGAVTEPVYRSVRHPLPGGSVLLLYTDGLVERRGEAVDTGLERLRTTALRVLDDPARDGGGESDELGRRCDELLAGALAGWPADDDVALLLVQPRAVLGTTLEVVWPARAEMLTDMRHLLGRWLREAGADDDERYDLLVAVSEAVTNAVEHAYGPSRADVRLRCEAHGDGTVVVTVRDWGRWRPPRGRDRGRGAALMRALVQDVRLVHGDAGTEVTLTQRLHHPARTSAQAGAAHDMAVSS